MLFSKYYEIKIFLTVQMNENSGNHMNKRDER